MGQFRRLHQLVDPCLRQIRQLKLHEQQLGADFGAGFADRLMMPRDIGIRRVGGKFKLRMACRLAERFENPLIFGNQRRQLWAVSLGQLAAPDIGKTLRGIARGGDIGCDGRIGNVAVEVRKVPDGAAVWHEDSLAVLTGRRLFRRLWEIWVYGLPVARQKRCCCAITPICLHRRQVALNIVSLDTKGGRVSQRHSRCGHRRSKGPGNSQVPVLLFVSTLESGTAVPTDGESRRQIMPTMLSAA